MDVDCDDRNCLEDNRKDYNVGILKQVQAIFGHLACSRLQYYVPRGLWRHFKLQGILLLFLMLRNVNPLFFR